MLRGIISFISDTFWIFRILYARARAPSLQFFVIFTDSDVIFSDFQIDEMVSECPKIMKISISSLYVFWGPEPTNNRLRNSEKGSEYSINGFRAFFCSCLGRFDAKNGYFRVFLMFLDHCAWSQILGGVNRPCAGTYKSKKIKIAKNEFKHPQSVIECRINGFCVHLNALGHHMNQSISPHFREF